LNPGVGANVPAAQLGRIRLVRVTVLANYGRVPVMSWQRIDHHTYTNAAGTRTLLADPGDNVRRSVLTTEIQMRNM
jgi:hypothetical protein